MKIMNGLRRNCRKVKQPKKLTRDLKLAVAAYGLMPEQWMLLKDGEVYVTIVHKSTGKTKIIDKHARRIKK